MALLDPSDPQAQAIAWLQSQTKASDTAGGYDQWGRPRYPQYQSATALPGQFQAQGDTNGDIGRNWLARATSQGPSDWAKMLQARSLAEQGTQQGEAAKRTSSDLARSQDALAMTGGLSGGAAERLAMQSADLGAQRGQAIASQGQKNFLDIGLADENTKLDLQKGLLDNQKWNIGNSLNEASKQNAFNLGRYGEQMKGYASTQEANAQANSGKK